MDRLDALIGGVIGMAIISAFLLGLAESIGAAPFWIITVGVLVLAFVDFYEECVRKPRNNGGKNSG